MLTRNVFPKNLRKYCNIAKKFTSGNRDSRAIVAKKRLNKIKDKNQVLELKLQLREALATKIENKYEQKYKSFLDDMIKKDKGLVEAKSKMPVFEEDYYVPLKDEDQLLLSHFDNNTKKLIEEGGRVQLYLAVKKHNDLSPDNQIEFGYIPMTRLEIKELEFEFPFVLEDDNTYAYVIQEGKAIYDDIKKMKEEEMIKMYTLIDKAYKENKSFDKETGKITAPFNTSISIDFKQIPDSYFVKILFVNGVIKSKEDMGNIFKRRYLEVFENLVKYFEKKDEKILKKMENWVEPHLFSRLKIFIENIENQSLKLTFERCKLNQEEKHFVFNNVLIKGVNVDRYKNGQPFDYIYIDTNENEGLRYYMHKYFAGYAQRYGLMHPYMTSYVRAKSNPNTVYSVGHDFKVKNKQVKFVKDSYCYEVTSSSNFLTSCM